MRILGFDPGTQRLGYGVLDLGPDGRPVHVAHGVCRAPGSRDRRRRIEILADGLRSVLREYGPVGAVALETPFVGRFPSAALALGEIRGAIGLVVAQEAPKADWMDIDPRSVKQAVTGLGGASKEAVALAVSVALGLRQSPPEDAADALAVALWAAGQRRAA